MKKKILWIILLIALAVAIIIGIAVAKPTQTEGTAETNTTNFNKSSNTENEQENDDSNAVKADNDTEIKEYQKIELSDGTLYALDGEQEKSDLTLGDNYFDTTISDMYINPEDYYDMNIEIEGMYLTDGEYSFVGRYSNSNLCAYCPAGYSFIEYQLDGTIDKELTAEQDWIKVIGTLQKANDETSYYQDYYYIKVKNIEIMNERGTDTVNN